MYDFTPTDLDQRIWAEELDGFVPDRVFDVHTHIYRWAFNLNPDKETGPYAPSIGRYFPEVTTKLADEIDAALLPGRQVERLAFPFPLPANATSMAPTLTSPMKPPGAQIPPP